MGTLRKRFHFSGGWSPHLLPAKIYMKRMEFWRGLRFKSVVSLSHTHLSAVFDLPFPKNSEGTPFSTIRTLQLLFLNLLDQNFGIFAHYQILRCADQKRAYRALVVGEMTWCISSLLNQDILPLLRCSSWSDEQRLSAYFDMNKGSELAEMIFSDAGWKGLNQLHRSMEISTRALLQPYRYYTESSLLQDFTYTHTQKAMGLYEFVWMIHPFVPATHPMFTQGYVQDTVSSRQVGKVLHSKYRVLFSSKKYAQIALRLIQKGFPHARRKGLVIVWSLTQKQS